MDLHEIKVINSKDKVDIESHFKLFAGPGAGKTTFLVNHIKNVLSNSDRLLKNKKIACITYTNIGVESILKNLDKTINKVEVSTIHSFLFKHIVKPYLFLIAEEYDIKINKIKKHDETKFMYSIFMKWIIDTNQKSLQFNDNHEIKARKDLESVHWVLNEFNEIELKRNNFYLPIKNDSLLKYKKICWSKGIVNHDDVLFFAYEILNKENRILDIIRSKFPYIFLDEFQDTSPIQAEIVKKLGEKETIIGVIGDEGQSIYSFQGAKLEKFLEFELNNMKLYKIEDNRRSTKEIIEILNHVRNDDKFIQNSPNNKTGNLPCLMVGNKLNAYSKSKEFIKKDVYSLSYKNETSNLMKFKSENNSINLDELLSKEHNERPWLITHIIHSIECCKQNKINDALKYMKEAYRRVENFSNKDSFENLYNLYNLYNNYENFEELSLKEFYNNYLYGFYGLEKRITSGNISNYYNSLNYKQVATAIKINDDKSFHKTIHKSKGDEFDNVILILLDEKELDFLISPNIFDETNRVYYVALSRAKENLIINIPKLTNNKNILEELGFNIINC